MHIVIFVFQTSYYLNRHFHLIAVKVLSTYLKQGTNHSKISSTSLILGTKNLAYYWDQTVLNKTSTRRPSWRLVDWKGDSISSPPLSCVGLKAGSRDPDKETAVHLPHYPAEAWKQVVEAQTRRQHFISPIILRGLKAGSRDPDKETAFHLPHYPAEVWKQVAETQTRRQQFISPIILRRPESR